MVASLGSFESRFMARQTCHNLYSLRSCRSIWLSLITDLQARNFVRLLPGGNLQELSLDALIELAKSSVQAPRSWSSSKPRIVQQIRLSPTFPLTAGYYDELDEARLLSGGQYVVFLQAERLRCWSVAEDRQIWEYSAQSRSTNRINIRYFTAEVVEDGRAAIVIIAGEGFPGFRRFRCVSLILELLPHLRH